MLKPEGQIFLTTVVSHPIIGSFKKHFKEGTWSKYLKNEKYVMDYTNDAMGHFRELAESVGFKVIKCQIEQHADDIVNFAGRFLVIHILPAKLKFRMTKKAHALAYNIQADSFSTHMMGNSLIIGERVEIRRC